MEQNQIWQVDVAGNIYETDFAGLTQWIAESSLLPEDKIRRGDMPWIQAKMVPSLEPYFRGQPPQASGNVITNAQTYNPSESQVHINTPVDLADAPTNFTAPSVSAPPQEEIPEIDLSLHSSYAPMSLGETASSNEDVLDLDSLQPTVSFPREMPTTMPEPLPGFDSHHHTVPEDSPVIAPVEISDDTSQFVAAPVIDAPVVNESVARNDESFQEMPTDIYPPLPGALPGDEQKTAPLITSVQTAEQASANKTCIFHPVREVEFTCRQCLSFYCSECPRHMAKVRICPKCGDMCHPYGEAHNRPVFKRKTAAGSGSSNFQPAINVDPNFSFADFRAAWSYPFKFPGALLLGGILNAAFGVGGHLGLAAVSVGSYYSGFMAILVFSVLAMAVVFGCAVKAVNQIAYGRSDESYMVSTEDFSIWDTILQPCFLGLATCLVSWGPALIIAWLIFKSFLGVAGEWQQYFPPENTKATAESTAQKKFLTPQEIEQLDAKAFEEYVTNGTIDHASVPNSNSSDGEESEDEESAAGTKTENGKDPAVAFAESFSKFVMSIMPLILLLAVTGVWAIIYFPTALTVAGYTQSIGSTLNPLVGLSMMREMGGTFFKAFGMYLLLVVLGFFLFLGVGVLTSPLSSLGFGQAPSQFIGAILSFYLYIVMACIFGLALYRSHEKLGYSVTK